jgi:hypothetical protein
MKEVPMHKIEQVECELLEIQMDIVHLEKSTGRLRKNLTAEDREKHDHASDLLRRVRREIVAHRDRLYEGRSR